MKISSMDLTNQEIEKVYGKEEIKAISLDKQIFSIHDYDPTKSHDNNEKLFNKELIRLLDATDYGIDDIIYFGEITEEVPLIIKQLLFNYSNQTDYLLYLKYPEKRNQFVYNLSQAYLVPTEQLTHQIIDALNDILKMENSDNNLELKGSYLNHRIIDAYSIVERFTPISEIELFRNSQHGNNSENILLGLSKKKLNSYTKFDNTRISHLLCK